jgi:hypothetical protein
MGEWRLGLLAAGLLACGQTSQNTSDPPQGGASGGDGKGGIAAGGEVAGRDRGGGGAGGSISSSPCAQLSCLAGSRFVYRVTGDWDGKQSGSPTEALPATAFVPVDGPSVLVEVSENGRIVTLDAWLIKDESGVIERHEQIVDGKVEGSLDGAWFWVANGFGRFVVQEESAGLSAEYAQLGSGEPVLSATRGTLTGAP